MGIHRNKNWTILYLNPDNDGVLSTSISPVLTINCYCYWIVNLYLCRFAQWELVNMFLNQTMEVWNKGALWELSNDGCLKINSVPSTSKFALETSPAIVISARWSIMPTLRNDECLNFYWVPITSKFASEPCPTIVVLGSYPIIPASLNPWRSFSRFCYRIDLLIWKFETLNWFLST